MLSVGKEALPFTVIAVESISASLIFGPTASGAVTAVLSAVIDGADLPFVLNLSGEGNYPPVAEAIVEVSGAGTAAVNGTYYRTEEIEDECPVYRLTGTDYRIYRANPEVLGWFIDNDFTFGPVHYGNWTETLTAPNGTIEDWWVGEDGVADPPSTVGEIVSSSGAVDSLPQGDVISPNFVYADAEGNTEGTTLYQWYRSDAPDDPTGTYSPISGEIDSSYTVVVADNGYHFKVLVTPVATDGITTGEPVWFGPSPQVVIPM